MANIGYSKCNHVSTMDSLFDWVQKLCAADILLDSLGNLVWACPLRCYGCFDTKLKLMRRTRQDLQIVPGVVRLYTCGISGEQHLLRFSNQLFCFDQSWAHFCGFIPLCKVWLVCFVAMRLTLETIYDHITIWLTWHHGGALRIAGCGEVHHSLQI